MKKFILGIITAVLLFTAGVFLGPSIRETGSREHSSSVAKSMKFDDIAELSTESMTGQYIYEFTEDKMKLLNIEVPFTGRKILITYDGTAKAGIKDASEIKVSDYDPKKKTIIVSVPQVKLLDVYTDNDRIYDVSDSVFNSFQIEDYPQLVKSIREEFRKTAENSDLTEHAEKSAETLIKDRVRSYYGEDCNVTVRWQKKETDS